MKLIYFSFLCLLFCISCRKENVDAGQSIEKKWTLNTVDADIEILGQNTNKSKKEVREEGIFYEFKSDGTYLSNASWNLGEISKGTTISNGKYTYSKAILNIQYRDEGANLNLSQNLKVLEINNQLLVVYVGKEQVLESFNNAVSNLDFVTATLVRTLLGQILKFDYTLSFSN